MTGAQLLVRALENEGIEYIFGVPGEENLEFLESLRTSSIKMIVTRHEQAAGFMAATIGRLTGKPGVCLSTLGPGATNLVTAIAYAQLGGMPLLCITGQKPIKRSKQGHFQIINTIEMMRPITKFSKQIIGADMIPSMVREACKVATEERPGAVHLELPEDIAHEEAIETTMFVPTKLRRPIAEEKAIISAVNLLKQAKRPLLLIGAGANRKRISNSLTAFVEKTKIPFFTTQMGKGVVDERHPQYLGTAALSSNDYIHQCIDAADLILNVGHDTIEKPPFFIGPEEKSKKVIHLNFLPATPDKIYAPSLEVIGDIANAVWQITSSLPETLTWESQEFWKMKKSIVQKFEQLKNLQAYPYKPFQVISEIRNCLDIRDVVALDNGMYKLWFARHFEAYSPNTLLVDNALATMGAGLPSAIAAKLMLPDQKVLCVAGDGGFLMNSQELETAVRLELDLVIVILRDNGYGMIEWKQQTMEFPSFGLTFGNPDFVAYAKSYGAHSCRVEKAGDLMTQIIHAYKAGGVWVIDTPIDYSDNKKVLFDDLRNIQLETE